MSRAAELEAQRVITTEFIAANPSQIVLTPRTQTVTPAGGRKWADGIPRPEQTMRLIDLSSAGGRSPGSLVTEGGLNYKSEFHLLGEWDAVVEVHDTWVDLDGNAWEVDEVLPDNGYEVRAVVTEHGLS